MKTIVTAQVPKRGTSHIERSECNNFNMDYKLGVNSIKPSQYPSPYKGLEGD